MRPRRNNVGTGQSRHRVHKEIALGLLYTHKIIQTTIKNIQHYNSVHPTGPHIHTRSSSRNAECCQPWRSVNAFRVFLTTPRYFQYLTMSSLPGQSSWVGVTMTAIGNHETKNREHENRRSLTRVTKPSCPLGSCCYSHVEVRLVIGSLNSSVKDHLWHDIIWANGGPPFNTGGGVREARS